MSLETSASESGEKVVNECMFAGKMCLIDCGVENCALIVLILFIVCTVIVWWVSFDCMCVNV